MHPPTPPLPYPTPHPPVAPSLQSVGYMIVPSTVENMPAPAPPVLGAPEPTGDDDTPGLQLGEVLGAGGWVGG